MVETVGEKPAELVDVLLLTVLAEVEKIAVAVIALLSEVVLLML